MGLYPGTIFPTVTNGSGLDVDAAAVAIVDVSGNQLSGFDSSRPGNVTVTDVAQSAVDVVLQASNVARRTIIFTNASKANLFVKLGSVATTALYSFVVSPNVPLFLPMEWYTGVIHGIWSAAGTGVALVTEITT